MLPGYPPPGSDIAPGAKGKHSKRQLGRAQASTGNAAPADAGGTRTRYRKPRLTVRPALPWAALAQLQAMGVRVTGETARNELTWEWNNAALG